MMSTGNDQNLAAAHLGEIWARRDPQSAIRWASAIASESARTAALVRIASGWARVNAPAAARWATTLSAGNPARAEAIEGALSYWSLTDAEAARNFRRANPN